MKDWLTANNHTVVSVLLLVLGVAVLGRALGTPADEAAAQTSPDEASRPYHRAMLILAIIVLGFLAGGLAQILFGVPMREVNWVMAFGAGLLGSFVGGLLISLLSGDGLDLKPSGIVGSVLGAMLVTIAWTAISTRHKD